MKPLDQTQQTTLDGLDYLAAKKFSQRCKDFPQFESDPVLVHETVLAEMLNKLIPERKSMSIVERLGVKTNGRHL